MTPKNTSFALILISLVAAVSMLVVSYVLDGEGSTEMINYIIIALWFIPFSTLSARAAKERNNNS
ncbi:MAG: hypothetical protein ACPG8W_05185 [Candidatus Promineifilaceae bacterium]